MMMQFSSTKVLAAFVAVVLAGAGWLSARGWSPFTPKDYGYFYRLNVKVSHQDEHFEMNIVVSCNPSLVPRFGMGAMQHLPRFYAERTKANHGIGVRVIEGCNGHTTANGGAPADLLPSIYWFPDADDMTFAIMYATEDAYENPLSQMKFHGATMHKATVAEFLAFQDAAKTKSILPVNVDRAPRRDPALGVATLAEIAPLGGKAPKPNWAYAGWCDAMLRIEVAEVARPLLREYWPAHRPKYWMMTHEMHGAFSKRVTAGHIYLLSNPWPVTGSMDIDLFWFYGVGSRDGLATRARGGRLQSLNREKTGIISASTPQKMPELYPLQLGPTYAFYKPEDKTADYVRTKIDRRAGQSKGFAYCQNKFVEDQRPLTALDRRFEVIDHFLPGWPRPVRAFVDDHPVDTTLMPQPYKQIYDGGIFVDYIIEEDKAVYRIHRYF